METASKMKQRHKMELRNLEKELKKLGKKKGMSKSEAKAEASRLRTEMEARHVAELSALEGGDGGADAAAGAGAGAGAGESATAAAVGAAPAPGGDATSNDGAGASKKAKKKSKAQRRRERREKEEAERDARIAAEEAGLVDYRQEEIDLIEAQVADLGYHICKITADGHCLYRSVARQMELIGEPIAATDAVQQLRDVVADYLRSHGDDYAMWLEFEPSDNAEADPAGALEKYCTRLSTTAVWGGQVEIQVLATVLKHPIHVYQAVGPVQKMGDFDTEPLRVSFHTKYYTLGFHYNSVEEA